MSEERATVELGSNVETVTNAEAKAETREQRKARLTQILERGIVSDRLKVDLPLGIYGEWVSDDPVDIARLQAMGFQIDTEYAPNRALHSSGAKQGKIGDVVHMICNQEIKDIIDEIRKEQFDNRHNKKRGAKIASQGEESEAAKKLASEGLPPILESQTHVATQDDIKAAMKARINQVI